MKFTKEFINPEILESAGIRPEDLTGVFLSFKIFLKDRYIHCSIGTRGKIIFSTCHESNQLIQMRMPETLLTSYCHSKEDFVKLIEMLDVILKSEAK